MVIFFLEVGTNFPLHSKVFRDMPNATLTARFPQNICCTNSREPDFLYSNLTQFLCFVLLALLQIVILVNFRIFLRECYGTLKG